LVVENPEEWMPWTTSPRCKPSGHDFRLSNQRPFLASDAYVASNPKLKAVMKQAEATLKSPGSGKQE
jgi:hypothetical protein